MKHNHRRLCAHRFWDMDESLSFSPEMYSKMKFGCDQSAQQMGTELANAMFAEHSDMLIANRVVVIPSPYNYVPNAATIMTKYFVKQLNRLLVNSCGRPVEYSLIHRKVSYTNDYGFLSKEKRKGLIDNDSFYINQDFVKGKLLIFIDDVYITGTHEDKLAEIIDKHNMTNPVIFGYFAQYVGNRPDIEGTLNFAAITSLASYVRLLHDPSNHVIIRPIKYVLGQQSVDVEELVRSIPRDKLVEIYDGCLAEGYHTLPHYQTNFQIISKKIADPNY